MFQEANELVKCFDFGDAKQYCSVTELKDVPVGFSVQRAYPTDTLFRTAIRKNVESETVESENGKPEKLESTNPENLQPDTVALIHVVYLPRKDHATQDRVPVFVDVNRHSRYLANHFDYDFDDPECPTQESVKESRRSVQPVNIESHEEYCFDHTINGFVDKAGRQVSGTQMLDELFEIHMATTRPVRGLLLRLKLTLKHSSTSVFEYITVLLKWILRHVFGRTLVEPTDFSAYFKGYPKDSLRLISEDTMTILGYRASKHAVVTFGLLGCFGSVFYICLGYNLPQVSRLFSNAFFGLCFSITLLWLLDGPVVQMIRLKMNLVIWLRSVIMFRSTQIRKTAGLYH